MKEKTCLAITLLAILSFAGCNDSKPASTTTESSPAAVVNQDASTPASSVPASTDSAAKPAKSKILIIYFSRVGISEPFDKVEAVSSASLPNGNTVVIANDIKEMTGGDIFQLITDKVYPANYDATTDLAQKEQQAKERPTLKSQPKNLADYDIIFLGYPNWWGTIPMALFTFLENNDLAGKTIIPFCTHEGSGLGDSQQDIKKLCPKSKIVDGLAVRGGSVTSAKPEVEKWVRRIGLHQ